jgi:sugar phosphate isomerase/epimerase
VLASLAKENPVTLELSRRQLLAGVPTVLALGAAPAAAVAAGPTPPAAEFRYCLNTSTLMGQKLDLVELVTIAGKVGYQAIEPWITELDRYAKAGGSLKELAKRIHDQGLSVPSAIGFAEWIVDDPQRRQKGLEEIRRSMDMVRQIGGQRLAAPPAGATQQDDVNLLRAAERYRALLDLGDRLGIVPQVELWGFSRVLSRLGEVLMVAAESGHARACVLLDVYHLYKGGSGFSGLRLLGASAMHVVHFNDYPANPPRSAITDAQRVYPGDGIAPLRSVLRDLRHCGFQGFLSLELFNRDYWKEDPLTVARTGLEKMRAVVQAAAS